MFRWIALLAALALPCLPTPASADDTHGCACIENQTPITVNYSLQWGDGQAQKLSLPAGSRRNACWKYLNPKDTASPPLKISFEYVLGQGGDKYRNYVLERVRASNPQNCDSVGKNAWYGFQRTNNNSELTLVKLQK